MSQKFGLDWKKHEAIRMEKLREIMLAEMDAQAEKVKGLDKPEDKQPKFR